MGAVGGVLRAFDKGPDFDLLEVVKNPRLQQSINRSLGTAEETLGTQERDLARFEEVFAAQTPRQQRFTEEGIGVTSDLFSGRTGDALRGLRETRRGARSAATERALDRIRALSQRDRARRGIRGRDSFADLRDARLVRDAEIDAALEDTAQERADFGFILQQQLANRDTRQQLLNQLLNRALQPTLARGQAQQSTLNTLIALQGLDAANNFRGLQEDPSTLARIAGAADAIDQGILNVASVAGGFLGAPGGSQAPNIGAQQQAAQSSRSAFGFGGFG